MADDDEDDELLGPGPTGPPATGAANPFSPAASQTGAGSPQVAGGMTLSQQDMMLMMRQMMDATAAASRAAEAAVAVANASVESKKKGIGASDLARILPKPDVFKPSTREEEHGTWIQWFWSLKQYLCALDTGFSDELAYIEGRPLEEILVYNSVESEQRSKQLYSLLASLVRGRGLQVVQRTPLQNGFEALRQLVQLFQPTSRTRSLGILSALTTMGHFKNGEPLLPQILDMERIMDEYERSSGKKLDDDFKTSIFLRSISGNMRNHLATILTEDVTYDVLREAALRFERMNAKWDARNLFQSDSMFSKSRGSDPGPVPMDVDAVQTKGKGKGKGKGKQQKGSGKGAQEGKGKQQKGSGKGAQKGKGKQQKGSGKGAQKGRGNQPGSGKGAQDVICHVCHKRGHYAKDCWHAVRQVNQQGEPSAPSVAPSSAPTTAGPSVSQAGQAGRSLNRVMVDMTALGDSIPGSSSGVRAVQVAEPSVGVFRQHRVCAEEFMGFLGIVRSLTQIPHSLPEILNLKPAPDDLHSPATFDMSYSDNDGIWTVDDSLESACAVNVADQQRSVFEQESLRVHAVQFASQDIQVVVDSGSDASCLPLSWAGVGLEGGKDPNSYRDAQGDAIKGSQTRTAVLQIGETKFKERWLLSSVTQPLFSVGKLLKQGWNIIHDSQLVPHLTSPDGQVRVPMHYQHNSLHATGTICNVTTCTDSPPAVRALEVRDPWLSLKDAFEEVGPGVYARRDFSASLIECSVALQHLGVQFRTTIRQDSTGWNVFELNQDLTLLEQHEAEFEPSRLHQVITIGSCERVDVNSLFGKVPPPTLSTTSEATTTAVAAGVGDEPDEDMYVPDFEHEDILNDEQLPPEPEEQDEALPQQGHLVVDGIELHEHCTLSTIRAAATKLGLGKSGGKTTVLDRIRSHLAKQRLLETHELSHGNAPALPREQAPVVGPSAEQKRRHSLCHIPFEPWCAFCTAYRARADKHLQARPESRENSTVAFDFCFTERATGGKGDKLVVLIMKDVHTHAIAAIPTPAKGGSIAYRYLVHEAVKFLNFCGSNPVTLKSDSEPACLALQQGIKDLRARMKLATILEQTEKGDHQANPAEQAVDQIRQLTGTILAELEDKADCKVSTMSPLHAWCWRHASWCHTRFAGANSPSAFELITGRPYQGKLVNFGEVVFGRVKSAIKGKPRWVKMMWLGKIGVSDLHVGITGQGMFIATRSVRRLASPDSYQSSFFEILKDQPWTQAAFLSGNLGSARAQKTTDEDKQAVTNGPMQEAPEPLENPEPLPYPGYLLPDSASLAELIPPPPLLAAGTPEPATPVQTNAQAQQGSSDMQVEPSAFTPLPSEPATAQENFPTSSGLGGLVPSGLDPQGLTRATAERPGGAETMESVPKRARLNAVQFGGEEFHHVDETPNLEFDDQAFDELGVYDQSFEDPSDYEEGTGDDAIPACLIHEFSEREPELEPAHLQELDNVAMEYEVNRLHGINVLEEVPGPLPEHRKLSTRFVTTWRPKMLHGSMCWLRRARLVAREFAFLDPHRENLYSPASNALQSRVIPSVFMNNRHLGWVMCALDVADAYFQCDQGEPTCTSVFLGGRVVWFRLIKCLPGQRDGSSKWFTTFSETLKADAKAELMPELPSLFRIPSLSEQESSPDAGGLLHVDDMLSTGRKQTLEAVVSMLKGRFKISVEWIINVGDELDFLKKRHFLLSETELIIQINSKHLDKLRELTGNPKTRKSPLPSGILAVEKSNDAALDPERCTLYRQAVGVLLYMQADEPASQFAIRLLSTYMSSPTQGAWSLLRHLVGYLTFTNGHCICLEAKGIGQGIKVQTPGVNVIEGYSDSDWAGDRKSRKSVSAAAICVNGHFIYGASRTQKVISLSSAEAEFHSAVSCSIDCILVKAMFIFLSPQPTGVPHVLIDNSAARAILQRSGVGRVRHLDAKLLWTQQKVKDGQLIINAVDTKWNVSDLGTKVLNVARTNLLLSLLNVRDSTQGFELVGKEQLDVLENARAVRVACKQLRHVSKRDRTGDTARILSIVLCALQAQEAMSTNNDTDALSPAMDDDEPTSFLMQMMELVLQAFFFIAELYEQYPVPFLIISQIVVILILTICVFVFRQTPTERLSRLHSIRASASANRDGSIELSIDAGLNEGSSGSRFSPEPAYPSDTHPSASRVDPAEVVHPKAQAKAKPKSKSKSKAKAKSQSSPVSPEVEARLHEWMMQNIAIPARQAASASASTGVSAGPTEASSSSQVPREEHVYITERTGRKYHKRRSCIGLNQADEIQRVGLAEAQRRGKVPCNVCFRTA